MIRFEILDYQVQLDGKMVASFEELKDAKAYGYGKVHCGDAECCDVVNQWTGEVLYHCKAIQERNVVEGFDW